MSPEEKAETIQRYSKRLLRFGPTPAALGWTKSKHRLRYRILLDYWLSTMTPQPIKLLDFGCGFGDLLGYACDRAIALDYTEVDINDDLIAVARRRYPQGRFVCHDLLAAPGDEEFDVVVSSGVHNARLLDAAGFTKECFALFDRISKHGFAVNFLSDRVNVRNEENHYSRPEAVLTLALGYSPRVSLRHDYMPFEFTIFVDKRSTIDSDLTVFAPYVEDCELDIASDPSAAAPTGDG